MILGVYWTHTCQYTEKTGNSTTKIGLGLVPFMHADPNLITQISIDPFKHFSMWIYNLMYCGSHSSSKQYIRIPCVIIYERDTIMIIVISICHRRRFHTYIGLYHRSSTSGSHVSSYMRQIQM